MHASACFELLRFRHRSGFRRPSCDKQIECVSEGSIEIDDVLRMMVNHVF